MLLAEKLLTTMYELENLAPSWHWNEDSIKENPPRYYRLQQIEAMLIFLGYNQTPREFRGMPIPEYINEKEEDLFLEIINQIEIPYKGIDKYEKLGDVVATFLYLYQFRMNLHNSLYPFLLSEGLGNYNIGEVLMEHLQEDLPKYIDWVDQILFFIVDPKKHEFNKELLVREHGYPDVNIREIDQDWI